MAEPKKTEEEQATASTTSDSSNSFERFVSLTKRLVSIPKEEIDKARTKDRDSRS